MLPPSLDDVGHANTRTGLQPIGGNIFGQRAEFFKTLSSSRDALEIPVVPGVLDSCRIALRHCSNPAAKFVVLTSPARRLYGKFSLEAWYILYLVGHDKEPL